MLPLRWVEPNVLEALVKKPSGVFHNCRVVLNDTRTSILKEYCTCCSENISQSTCAHIVALVIAYEDNPAGVLPFSTLANNSAQSQAASGPHKSAPAHQSTKSPGSSANTNSDRNSKGGKKLVFNSSKPAEAAASRPVRDDSQLELDDCTKQVLHEVAEKAALEQKIQEALKRKTEAASVSVPSTAEIMEDYFKSVEDNPSDKDTARAHVSNPEDQSREGAGKGEPDFFDRAPSGKTGDRAKPPSATLDEPSEAEEESGVKQPEHPAKKWGKLALDFGKVMGEGLKDAAVELGKVLDDIDKKSQESGKLNQTDVYWSTSLDRDSIYELLFKTFSQHPIGVQHRWSSIRPIPEYYQIVFEAKWQEHADNWVFWTQVNLIMSFILSHVTPLIWKHFNPFGRYQFNIERMKQR